MTSAINSADHNDATAHLGISDEEAQEAIQAAGHRLKRAGEPPHSVSLIYGWNED